MTFQNKKLGKKSLMFCCLNLPVKKLTAAQVSCTQSSPSPASVLWEYQTFLLSFTIFLCSIVLTNCCYFSRDRLLSTVELQVSTRAERILLHLEHVLQISKISKIPFTSTRRTRAKISEIFGWDFRRNDDLINSFWISLTFRVIQFATFLLL